MRVLIAGNFYAPEKTGIAPYTTGLAEHLATRGCNVRVITSLPSYPHWRIYPEYRGVRLRLGEAIGGVDVHRVRGYVPRTQSVVHRWLYEGSFLLGGLASLPGPTPDVVVGVAPALASAVLARLAARRFSCPYVLIVQDLTGPAAGQSGITGGAMAATPIRAVEGWAARGASAVGIIAEGFRTYLESVGVDPARIERVRNWMHIAAPTLDRAATRHHLGLPQRAVLCLHAGNMGYKQGLTNVIECARLAADAEPQLLFVLMGDGSQRSLLVKLAQSYQLRNLRFLPIQPTNLLSSVLASADILLLNQRPSVTNMSLPGKLTSYFASGRPLVAAVAADSETAREVAVAGVGELVPPGQPELLLEALRKLAADPGRQASLGAAGRRYANVTLSADHALARLEELIRNTVAADSVGHQRIANHEATSDH